MRTYTFLFILALATLVYAANFWGTSIYILDEAKNAGCAMEMYQRGDLVVPTFNDALRTDKPPLHYYAMMMAYRIFGINPFAARLFSVLAGILTVAVVFIFTRKILGQSVAFFTGLVMIASLQLAIQFHLAVPDPYLILLMTLAFMLFYHGYQHGNRAGMLAFYAAAGLAFLAKGLIAIALPGLVILLYLISKKELNLALLRRTRLLEGALLFLLVALPWYAAVGYYTKGAWLEGFFIKHNLERYTATMEGHRGFPGVPFVIVIGALLPFSIFIIQACVLAWRNRKEQPFVFYCLLVAVAIPAFFCFSKTILPSYPAPALPFAAIVLGYYLHNVFMTPAGGNTKRNITISLIVYLVIALAIPAGVYLALKQEPALQHLQPVSTGFIILPLCALAALYFYRQVKNRASLYLLTFSWVVVALFFFYYCYPQLDKQNPVAGSSHLFKGNAPVAYFGAFNPAYVFMFRHSVMKLDTPEAVAAYFTSHPGGHLITYKKYLPQISSLGLTVDYAQKDLFETQETVVLSKGK